MLNETNILLNLTNVKKGGKVIIEYEDDFFGYIKVYGYYSNDTNNIQYQSGKELDFITIEAIKKGYKKAYIKKKTSDLYYAILKVSSI